MPTSNQPILVLNAGSSSLKYARIENDRTISAGAIDRIGAAGRSHDDALRELLAAGCAQDIVAVGHRVVHGGDLFAAPVRVTPEILAQLETLIPLAPLHQPHNLAAIRFLATHRPELPQVACFDTAFHATLGRLERMFALPTRYFERGIKRYGFHGLSYEYIASQLPSVNPRAAAGRTVVCHLGNGASMCAMLQGRSVASTMGFTALDGLPMGTRCGAIDPGVLLHLLSHEGLNADQLTDLLYHQSGLLGLSGVSSDMRDLLTRPEAAEAVAYFCYRIARELGALATVLGGLDALVFTAGIGEHSAEIRARVGAHAAWLGVRLDASANAEHRTTIHANDSTVAVLVIPTNEERMIAHHVRTVIEA